MCRKLDKMSSTKPADLIWRKTDLYGSRLNYHLQSLFSVFADQYLDYFQWNELHTRTRTSVGGLLVYSKQSATCWIPQPRLLSALPSCITNFTSIIIQNAGKFEYKTSILILQLQQKINQLQSSVTVSIAKTSVTNGSFRITLIQTIALNELILSVADPNLE